MTGIDETVFRYFPFNLTVMLTGDRTNALSIDLPELERAVARLAPDSAACLMDRFVRGMDVAAIADKYGTEPGRVTDMIEDAVDTLKERASARILVHPDTPGGKKSAPIEDIGLNVRAYNCMKRYGIDTLGQLSSMTLERLLSTKSVGKRTAGEILAKAEPSGVFLTCEEAVSAAAFPERRFRFRIDDGGRPETYAEYVLRTKGPDKELVRAIMEAERDGVLAVIGDTGQSIETDDFQLDKRVEYRLVRPDEQWYGNRVCYVSKAARDAAGYLAPHIVSLLMSLDPDMTRTLRKIYLIADAADLETLNVLTGTEPCELPDCVDPDDPDACLGCHWNTESSIVLDLKAIARAAQSAVDDAESQGLFVNYSTEFDIGVYTTLTHEIYHLAAADPFLGIEDDEAEAERYGRQAYEDWALA